eukprot:TRINITY_DN25083_c0_g1_i2.p1 TRINITY_DN25083_c0_g1~~TRINITY_DN25083_c0_g1_i2.p1  ORF type:complete len:1745 (-),score=392.72 TRINITY_DN25083_c0_g1_i2:9-5243(-)
MLASLGAYPSQSSTAEGPRVSAAVTLDEPAARVRQAAAAATAAAHDDEVRRLAAGEAELRALATHPDLHTDEDSLFALLKSASGLVVDLERAPPYDPRALDEAQRLVKAVLGLCAAWCRLAVSGALVEGAEGLRGQDASDIVFHTFSTALASESGLGASLLLAFQDLGGLSLLGRAVCHVEEAALVSAMRKLRAVASVCGTQARRQGSPEAMEAVAASIEGFRGKLFERLQTLAARPGRRLRMPQFKEMVAEIGGVLSGAYASSQVFELGCLLSMQLTLALAAYCPGVNESDALEALDWLASVLRNLLDSGSSGGALSSPVAIREWVEDSDLWAVLLQRAGCRTQHHAHHIMAVLLTRRALAPGDLVVALANAGALSQGTTVPPPSRLAMQSALLASASSLDAEAVLDLFGALCGALGFANLSAEGIDLLVQLTQRALAVGYDPVGSSEEDSGPGLARSLAVSHLLRYLQWGYRQDDREPLLEESLDFARRALLHVLLPHPAFVELMPAVAAEALLLAVAPLSGPAQPAAAGRCSRVLGSIAVSAAAAGAAAAAASGNASASSLVAACRLCSALPRVGAEAPLSAEDVQSWVAAFTDALSCFLRLPKAQIGTREVGTLWARMIVRPVLGMSVSNGAMQYFKLAFMAQPSAGSPLLAPLHAAPNPPPEVRLAHASIFIPASFEDDPPPLASRFFFPEAQLVPEVGMSPQDPSATRVGKSPPRLPHALRRSLSSVEDFEGLDLKPELDAAAAEPSAAEAAAAAGIVLPDTSASAPRLRLDRVQAVMQGRQSAGLFGELTVYDATERRLWDEFDELGRVDDVDALRQRDAAAIRCLAALDQEIDGAGRAGRELPSPLTEARAKFSSLCELVTRGSAADGAANILVSEAAFAQAEDDLVAATAAHRRDVLRCRRRGEKIPSAEAVNEARSALTLAHLALVKEVRLLAQWAQLGLVEVTGTPGLARALRAAGPGHGDPLLERLLKHSRWCARQAEDDQLKDVPEASSKATHADAKAAEVQLASAQEKPGGLSCYEDLSPLSNSGRVLSAKSRVGSQAVVLKSYRQDEEEACLRELQALQRLKGSAHVIALLDVFRAEGATYLELPLCAGGTVAAWCEKHGAGVIRGEDADSFVRCLAIWRQLWQAVEHIHFAGVCHGDLTLFNMLLTVDQRPLVADFRRSVTSGLPSPARSWPAPTPDYAAPEVEQAGAYAEPTHPGDIYSGGAAMAKAFMGLDLEVSSCPYHPTRGQRCLPEECTDVDVADLLQQLLAQNPGARPLASSIACHRALDPAGFLRRRGLLGGSAPAERRSPAQAFVASAELLREEYRGRRVDEPLMFSRGEVFDTFANSKVGEWQEAALLGEWRVILNDEPGVDGGGLRREVVSLFLEQLEQSCLVLRAGQEAPGSPVTLFVNDRRRAERSPQQWRQMWTNVGAMLLRALVHFGNAPVAFSSAVFDCALGRLCRLPPDDVPHSGDDDVRGCIDRLLQIREAKGDEWARSQLLDLLRRLRRADPQKEAGYRWMLGQREQENSGGSLGSTVYSISSDSLETIEAMVEPQSLRFLQRLSSGPSGEPGPVSLSGAALEWVLLWDIYLKYLGGGDRWLAYEALAEGFTVRGRRQDMWSTLTGEHVVEALEGASLTADMVADNLEFKPSYGYEVQIQSFRQVIDSFSPEELSMFLRFATGIGRLPASRRFPAGQKLTIRFMPDHLDRLPSAHTCFWAVDVPPYEDVGDMAHKLRLAIAARQPFTLS